MEAEEIPSCVVPQKDMSLLSFGGWVVKKPFNPFMVNAVQLLTTMTTVRDS